MLKITSKHLEVTTPIRERIEMRLAKLERYDIQFISSHIIITEDKPSFVIEASIQVPHGELFAQAKHENLYSAINGMGHKLEKQIKRLVHKDESQRHQPKPEQPTFDEEESLS